MHKISQIKVVKIYIASIYIYTRLGLGIYDPYIYIYNDIKALVKLFRY